MKANMQALANFVTGSPAGAGRVWQAMFPAALSSIAHRQPGAQSGVMPANTLGRLEKWQSLWQVRQPCQPQLWAP